MTAIDRLSDEYFEALGRPKPGKPFDLLDVYRFHLAYRQFSPGSVLDVGVYFGDFLKLACRDNREVFGTEVNIARKNFANSILGENIIVVDFRNGRLTQFQDDSVDNVVAMEVVEHIPDDQLAISELCRVARKKVVITVPFQERIQTELCVYCNKYTPHSGHLHSYDFDTFSGLVPSDWRVAKESHFAKPLTRKIGSYLPKIFTPVHLLYLMDALSFGVGHWLLVVLEPAWV
jgi:ubiquinone/menaquinone biosynthesis C-methylase UbiE